MRIIIRLSLLLGLLVAMPVKGMAIKAYVSNLRCEYLEVPLGIDTDKPRLTWEIVSSESFTQAFCQVSVATNRELLQQGKADVWRSERIPGSMSHIVYNGKELLSHTCYYWKVEVWSMSGRKLSSPISTFETAKLAVTEWDAEWISDTFDKEFRKAPLLRKQVDLKSKGISSARLYVSGVGYYEFFY